MVKSTHFIKSIKGQPHYLSALIYIRGITISYSSLKKYQSEKNSLQSKIKSLEKHNFNSQKQLILDWLIATGGESDTLTTRQVGNRLKHKYYEQGHNPGKLLAWHFRGEEASIEIFWRLNLIKLILIKHAFVEFN